VILGIHRQHEGENDAISFLTGHVIDHLTWDRLLFALHSKRKVASRYKQ
jgi:hypothetical protein